MERVHYLVSEFSIKHLEKHILVSTVRGVTHVPKELENLFFCLQSLINRTIYSDQLISYILEHNNKLGLDNKELIIKLLEDANVIYESKNNEKLRITIHMDDSDETKKKIETSILFSLGNEIITRFNNSPIRIIYIEDYPKNNVIAENINNNEMIFISYYYKSYFIIDAPYIPALGFPCHSCNLMNLINEGSKNIASLITKSECAQQLNKWKPYINDMYRNVALFNFSKRIQEILLDTNYKKSHLLTTYLDLHTGISQFDTPIHNPTCSCLIH